MTPSNSVKVSILGFSSFDVTLLKAFFQPEPLRRHRCGMVNTIAESEVIVLNADNLRLVQALKNNKPKQLVVMIGAHDSGTGWPRLERPLLLNAILSIIDEHLGGQRAGTDIRGMLETKFDTNTTHLAGFHAGLSNEVATAGMVIPKSLNDALKNAVKQVRLQTRKQETDFNFQGVMVVDDNELALNYMHSKLKILGINSVIANSGRLALSNLRSASYKVVFMDVVMDGMDGYQVCKSIKRANYGNSQPPVVIMLTSRGGTIDKIRGSLSGCDAYLTKPVSDVVIMKTLKRFGVVLKPDLKVFEESVRKTSPAIPMGSQVASLAA